MKHDVKENMEVEHAVKENMEVVETMAVVEEEGGMEFYKLFRYYPRMCVL